VPGLTIALATLALATVDVDEPGRFLTADRAGDGNTGLSDLDVSLTGIVTGPERMPADHWLSVIWGGAVPEFGWSAEMRKIADPIQDRYNNIATGSRSDPENFQPNFRQVPARLAIATWPPPPGDISSAASPATRPPGPGRENLTA
jgi:hypothetical protein